MTINQDVITYIIGGVVVLLLLFPIIIKQYFVSKTKGKVLVRVVTQQEEEMPYLLKMTGSTTEPTKDRNRAYIPMGKHHSSFEVAAGNTFETWYPEGMPRFLQVRIRAMEVPEGNPIGLNFYGPQEALRMTDYEVGTIHKEAYSKAAIETSNDTRDVLKEVKGLIKPGLNKTLVYIMLGIIVIGIIASAYLAYQNMQGINGLQQAWGW